MKIAPSIKNLTKEQLEECFAQSLHRESEQSKVIKSMFYDLEELRDNFVHKKDEAFDTVEKETYEEIIYKLNELINKYE